ncbi:hypothetical protein KSU1_D0908 [Candidatus Jettenia caeni]|uniref:Uncharacterized protein n=1 Tax=Candidatus Jettenia caeni TaxID=247490 RepID=I3IR72_9BACT|nr:hypothetical protein KSU1_D0908 [Candidatus Jettenia caeni]
MKLSLSFDKHYTRIKIIVNKNIRNNTLLLITFHKHSIKSLYHQPAIKKLVYGFY